MHFYIMGRGHSGSTILDAMLGSSSTVVSVGELIQGFARADKRCSCGVLVRDCPFWCTVRQQVESSGVAWDEVRAMAAAQRQSPNSLHRWSAFARVNAVLLTAIERTARKQHVLDSSKSPARGLFLLRHDPDARVLHLVRNPRDVAKSYWWRHCGGERGLPAVLFAPVAWLAGNLISEWIAYRYPERVLRIRYEDLSADPGAILARIAHAFDLKLDDVIHRLEHGEPFKIGHTVAGNRIRNERLLSFEPQRSTSRAPAPLWLRTLTVLICWPLMLFYRYEITSTPAAPGDRPPPAPRRSP